MGKYYWKKVNGSYLDNDARDDLHKLKEIHSFEDFYKELENHPRTNFDYCLTIWDEFQEFIQGELFS
jgi:predicted CopG family antitoxin|tara:strand:- start:99 stop:299 length:201 start_codon:yes stop_codon:yes gene_type:complete